MAEQGNYVPNHMYLTVIWDTCLLGSGQSFVLFADAVVHTILERMPVVKVSSLLYTNEKPISDTHILMDKLITVILN
jgi:hypothetical protein